MELPTVSISSVSPNFQGHHSTIKNRLSILKTTCLFSMSLQNQLCLLPSKTRLLNSLQDRTPQCRNHTSIMKTDAFLETSRTHFSNSLQNRLSNHRTPFLRNMPSTRLSDSLKNRISNPETSCFLRLRSLRADHCSSSLQNHPSAVKTTSFLGISDDHLSSFIENHLSACKTASFFEILITHISDRIQNHSPIINHSAAFSLVSLAITFPSFAAETSIPTEQLPGKIDLESILISIDNFFNRYPFFVASVTFVWLVVIPLTQEYLKKYKYSSALDAFRKLRDNPNAVLLDIRSQRSLAYIPSPNLKILKKAATQVEYSEGEEDGFMKEVLKNFNDPGNTIICVLDNFDGNSLKVAELLVTNGFKEAYAIKGGLRGKDGWQEIQEKFLPPSVHVYPRKKVKGSQKHYVQKEKTVSREENGKIPNSKIVNPGGKRQVENGSVKPAETTSQAKLSFKRPLSPYPNYPDFKPPASPSPSKPQK